MQHCKIELTCLFQVPFWHLQLLFEVMMGNTPGPGKLIEVGFEWFGTEAIRYTLSDCTFARCVSLAWLCAAQSMKTVYIPISHWGSALALVWELLARMLWMCRLLMNHLTSQWVTSQVRMETWQLAQWIKNLTPKVSNVWLWAEIFAAQHHFWGVLWQENHVRHRMEAMNASK